VAIVPEYVAKAVAAITWYPAIALIPSVPLRGALFIQLSVDGPVIVFVPSETAPMPTANSADLPRGDIVVAEFHEVPSDP
jgi:hypothetical protein